MELSSDGTSAASDDTLHKNLEGLIDISKSHLRRKGARVMDKWPVETHPHNQQRWRQDKPACSRQLSEGSVSEEIYLWQR